MNCAHGIRIDKDCRYCATGTEPATPAVAFAGYVSDVAIKNQVDKPDDPKFYLGIMRNIEREISRQKRKHTQNWVLVQDYLLGHTSKGGSTSSCIQCRWMGVDPEGYTFR